VPSRRKSDELVPAPAAADTEAADTEAADTEAAESGAARQTGRLPKGYTPSKRERGLTTPKRPNSHVRRPAAVAAGGSRKALTKEQKRELREVRRQRRREVSEGMRRGDPQYLPARDQGPERAIARDVVDSRRTVGTWFFAGALVVLLGSSRSMPSVVQLVSTALWSVLAMAVILDSFLLCRRVRRLVRERHPDSTHKLGGLYLYTVMRSLTFRRMRIPLPRRKIGEAV
jgi:hypothetical protein